MDCNKCGFKNPEGMRFCGGCAAPLAQQCPACGANNPPDFSFCGHCANPLTAETTAPESPNTPHQPKQAERRQLTVLFCDLVGSSTLSEILDPEELRDIMRDYHATCGEIITRYGGHVAQYLGDGILVYFGYPKAHEDDPQRAIQAALDIVSSVPRITYTTSSINAPDNAPLAVRIGVHTGLVVVGKLGDDDKRNLALGETPNIAARVQGVANSNGIVVSEATHLLLGDEFDSESLGQHQLKGFSQPLELFQIQKSNTTRRRGQFSASDTRTALIGREQDTSLLLERFDQALKGIGQLVLLSGEPGTGKTRMVQLLRDQIAGHDCSVLECAGTAYYQNSYLFPVIDMLRRTFQLDKHDSDEAKIQHIETRIDPLGLDTESIIPVLAELLSIPLNDRYPAPTESTPQHKKQQTQDTLISLFQALAQQRLVLLIVEDLQWIDPSTIELLTLLAGQPGLSNTFALFTFRNEFSTSWPRRAHLTRISLNRLTREQSALMIQGLSHQTTLPESMVAEIINKTDGIPFFIEEFTTAVLESSLTREQAHHLEPSTPGSQLSIPSSLQDLLMSRLDSLGDEKSLVQISAILGREFDHEVLRIISSRDEESFAQGIDHLINAEMLMQHGKRPNALYSFRHALLREAAYQSLLKRTRQQYHQRIAELLKADFPQMVLENPELLAHHCTEAGDFQEALKYWLQAGRLALQHSANIEAIAHLKQGLSILEAIPESAEKHTLELAMQICQGQAHMITWGYAAPEVERAYARAMELCKDITDIATIFPVLCGLWEYYLVRADLEMADTLANEIFQLAQNTGQAALTLEAHRAMGTTQFWRGHLAKARHFLKTDSILDQPDNLTRTTKLMSYYQDSQVATLANSGSVLWLSGETEKALNCAHQALNLAKRLAHPFSQVYALHFVCTLSQLRGDRRATAEHAELQIALSKTYGFAFWGAMGEMFLAWVNAGKVPSSETISAFQQALTAYETCGSRIARSYFLAMFAELQQQAGDMDGAWTTIENALRETTVTGECFFKSELLRIKGELLISQPTSSHDTAETVLSQALELAQQQGAHALALRTSISLANLWKKMGKGSYISDLLHSQLSQINNTGETLDLANAHELLKHISVNGINQ